MTMGGSQFCFSVVIVNDTIHEGSIPEQVTLSPVSASSPDLLVSPPPSVTILIKDNDGEYFKTAKQLSLNFARSKFCSCIILLCMPRQALG